MLINVFLVCAQVTIYFCIFSQKYVFFLIVYKCITCLRTLCLFLVCVLISFTTTHSISLSSYRHDPLFPKPCLTCNYVQAHCVTNPKCVLLQLEKLVTCARRRVWLSKEYTLVTGPTCITVSSEHVYQSGPIWLACEGKFGGKAAGVYMIVRIPRECGLTKPRLAPSL